MNRSLKTFSCLLSSGLLLNFALGPLPAHAQITIGNTGCPTGTRESQVNLVRNGTFSTNAGTGLGNATQPSPVPARLDFFSNLPYRGDSVYPSDFPNPPGGVINGPATNPYGGGGLSIEDERFRNGQIPGALDVVRGRGVKAEEAQQVGAGSVSIPTYLYSNPNLDTSNPPQPVAFAPPLPNPLPLPRPLIWQQTITVTPSTTYNFKALFFNLLAQGGPGVDPQIQLLVTPSDSLKAPFVVGDNSPVPGFPRIQNIRQAWIPVQSAFTTGPAQNTVTLQIIDRAQNISGDDFGLTAISLRACLPDAPPNISMVKRITRVFRAATGAVETYGTPGVSPVDPSFTGVISPTPALLQPGDLVEYTIYYVNDSTTRATNLEICDPIPRGTRFTGDPTSVPAFRDLYQSGRGISYQSPKALPVGGGNSLSNTFDGDLGEFANPLTPRSSCPGENAGNQGAVVVRVGTVEPGQAGFVKFVTQVN